MRLPTHVSSKLQHLVNFGEALGVAYRVNPVAIWEDIFDSNTMKIQGVDAVIFVATNMFEPLPTVVTVDGLGYTRAHTPRHLNNYVLYTAEGSCIVVVELNLSVFTVYSTLDINISPDLSIQAHPNIHRMLELDKFITPARKLFRNDSGVLHHFPNTKQFLLGLVDKLAVVLSEYNAKAKSFSGFNIPAGMAASRYQIGKLGVQHSLQPLIHRVYGTREYDTLDELLGMSRPNQESVVAPEICISISNQEYIAFP